MIDRLTVKKLEQALELCKRNGDDEHMLLAASIYSVLGAIAGENIVGLSKACSDFSRSELKRIMALTAEAQAKMN